MAVFTSQFRQLAHGALNWDTQLDADLAGLEGMFGESAAFTVPSNVTINGTTIAVKAGPSGTLNFDLYCPGGSGQGGKLLDLQDSSYGTKSGGSAYGTACVRNNLQQIVGTAVVLYVGQALFILRYLPTGGSPGDLPNGYFVQGSIPYRVV